MGRGRSQREAAAVEALRVELAVAIDDAIQHAPRRYRIIHWLATETQGWGFVGRWLERRRVVSYEKRVKARVKLARHMAEASLPRRHRRTLRGGPGMTPSTRSK